MKLPVISLSYGDVEFCIFVNDMYVLLLILFFYLYDKIFFL